MKLIPIFCALLFLFGCHGHSTNTADQDADMQSPQSASSEMSNAAGSPKLPPQFHIVKPLTASNARTQGSAPNSGGRGLEIHQGPYFTYALPPGWHAAEEGQYAVTLVSPDSMAMTLMVGNSGYYPNANLAQFVQQKFQALQPSNFQMSQGQPAQPIAGFQSAVQFQVSYTSRHGVPTRGVAKASIATSYDTAVIVMTASMAAADHWSQYESWLPSVGDQITATNGGAFGRRGVMATNLHNSIAYGEAVKRYNDWSQKNWQATTDYRDGIIDKQQGELRDNLGSTKRYVDPFNSNTTVDLPQDYKYFWVNSDGTYAGSNDPSSPNQGAGGNWKRVTPKYQ